MMADPLQTKREPIAPKRHALGRGIDALIPPTSEGPPMSEPPPGFYDDHQAADGAAASRETAPPSRRAGTILGVLHRWRAEGPLVHEATGLTKLDELTGGGPVYGSRWYVLGAPDGGKTLLLAQIAHVWMQAGIVVGILAIDEEDGDLVTRLVQRTVPLDLERPFFTRSDCETRSEDVLSEMEKSLEDIDSCARFYGPTWTIEAAAEDLHAHAESLSTAERPRRAALFVDSIQQATSNALCIEREREPSPREVVTANVAALRQVATRYRLITIATSEMNRNAYRSVDAADAYNDMAAAKESGAVEYSGRVIVSLRSVKDHGDLVQVRVVKNKHGASWPREPDFHWRIDRLRQQLADTESPDQLDADEERDAKGHRKVAADAASVAVLVAETPGITVNATYSALRARYGSFSEGRADAAMARLGHALVRRSGKNRSKHLHLDGAAMPESVMALVPLEHRPMVAKSTPPTPAEAAQ